MKKETFIHMKTIIRRIFPLLAAAVLGLPAGCEMNSDMDLPLNVNSNAYSLPSSAGITRIPIYSTGEWSVRLSEEVDWASIDRLGGRGNGTIIFKYAPNYGVPRAVDVLFSGNGREQAIRMTQAGEDPEMNLDVNRLELFADAWSAAVALNNNLKEHYTEIRDTVVYSIIPGEDDDPEDLPAPDEAWVDGLQIDGEYLRFRTLANTTTHARKAVVTLSYTDAMEQEHTSTITLEQGIEQARILFSPEQAKVTRKATTVRADMTHNLGSFITSVTCTPVYEGTSEGWISNLSTADNVFSCEIAENESGAPRTASVHFELKSEDGSLTLTPAEPFLIEQTYEVDYRLLIAGASGSVVIDDPSAFIEGYVISDKDNANVETTPNSAPNATDYGVNARTAYVEMLDGSYGFRLRMQTEEDNTLDRYQYVRLSLNGLTLTKEADPERYTLSGVTAGHILEQVDGSESDLPVKEKSIGQLTDDDLYTYVRLRDVEFAIPDGAYTNVNEGYFGTANHTSCVPRALCDANGGLLYMLVNNKTPWRRDGTGMPAGNGALSGIIVHDLLPRYGYTNEGYIGRYSIRELEKEDIEIPATSASSERRTLVEWNWEDGVLKKNADLTFAPDSGEGSLWCTDPSATAATDNEYNGLSTTNNFGKRALKFENTYWWNFDQNEGYAVALRFSTEGAGSQLTLNFTNSQGNAGGTSIYGPVYWQIEYSTDGQTFTTLPESTFCARPFVFWSATMTYCATPGYADRVFVLPESLCNQPEVTILIKAAGTQCIASNTATVEQGDTGTITSDMATNKRSPMRFGTISVKCNK